MPKGPESTAPRNLVVCCDGTSNEIGVNISNVLKLFRMCEKDQHQRVYYYPGVGTIAQLATWGRLRQKIINFVGLATGYGLDDNILKCYRWLCANYRDGDHIFLFGFSRGSYTVRAIAGMIDMIGLLGADQQDIAAYALTAYKCATEQNNLKIAWQFGRISGARDVTIHFMGVWDTVASVIVPRPDRWYLPSLQFLPYTMQNPRVRIFRQACSIDERRRMFRLYRWKLGENFKPTRFYSGDTIVQDVRQVWFAGVHADIGGGYPEEESGLSKYPLVWMVDQGMNAGLRVNGETFSHLALGAPEPNGLYPYVEPEAEAFAHKSLSGTWWILEFWPKRVKYLEWPKRFKFLGDYIPRGEPRLIEEGAHIHQSVQFRMEEIKKYRPVNLPQNYEIEPWIVPKLPPTPVAPICVQSAHQLTG
jgi:uncharacterized protein (DUF2235 family)